jgi:predicted DNA-binding transcriptional regulator YafY
VTRDDFRTFRVDRIDGEPALGERVAPRPPPEGDLRTYVSRALSTTVYEVRARVILHAPFEAIAARFSPSSALLERVDDRRCRLTAGAHSAAIVAGWLLTLDVDFEIEEPAELREQVRALHARLGRVLAKSARRGRDKAALSARRRRR